MAIRSQLRRGLRRLSELRRRRTPGDERTWIEVRALQDEDVARFAEAVPGWFAGDPGVRWARYNGAFGRIVVAHEPGVDTDELVYRLSALEEHLGLRKRPFAADPVPFPGESEPLTRAAIETAADAAGLVAGAVMRATGVPVVPAEIDFEAVLTMVRNVPVLRQALDEHVGRAAADLGLALSGAVSGALLQGRTGLVTDAVYRILRMREVRGRQRAWAAREADLAGHPDLHPTQIEREARPRPLPPGPVERYVEQALPASLGGFGYGVASTARVEDAITAIFGGVPKAARQGREAWAAWLGRRLADQGVIVVDPPALRRLDRIDTVVVDGACLAPVGGEVIDVVAVGGAAPGTVRSRVRELFDERDPYRIVRKGPWTLGPLSALPVEAERDTSPIRAGAGPGGRLLGLLRSGELCAIVAIRPDVDPHAEALVESVRGAGLRLVALCAGDHPVGWAQVDEVCPGLPGSEILRQQAGEHTVLYVGRDAAALGRADVGLATHDASPPFAADVILSGPLSQACGLVCAVPLARDASQQSVIVAEVVALAGLVLAVEGLGTRAARRILSVSNLATLVAMGNGVRLARDVRLQVPLRRRDHTPWHALAPEVALDRLGSSAEGLTAAAAMRRARVAEAPPGRAHDFRRILVQELANPLSPVLATGAALSALIGSPADAAMVASILALNGVVGAVQQYRAEQAMAALGQEERRAIRVLRDGVETEVDAAALVPGDVVSLQAGEVVPADCRILVAEALEVDESALTGESVLVPKQAAPTYAPALAERSSMLWAGTTIGTGRATAVVVAVGTDTVSRGAARTLTPAERGGGGLEARLEQITQWTVPVAVLSGVGILVSGLLRRRSPHELVGAAVSLAVAAVPEGLPILATLAQLSAARRLAERGALVRNHRAVEALGRVDVVCADKTGTLTEGRMRLAAVTDCRELRPCDDLTDLHRSILADALRATPAPDGDEQLPHTTDQALLEGAREAGVERTDGLEGWEALHVLPFEPGRAYHATLGDQTGRLRLCVKGSPEVLIPRCDRVKVGTRNRRLKAVERADLLEQAVQLAGEGYRVLVVAERGARKRGEITDDRVRRLVFRGLVLLSDPLRGTARSAVDRLRSAGVDVVMITGDHPATGARLAEDLGLPTHRVVTGPELDRTSDEALQELIGHVAVFARVTPEQKVRIVGAFQANGRVVAMTGDGANDAPAIRLADVGIALGEKATPAARQAADLVVLDERIETLVEAVLEGRALWTSVRKAVALLVGGNLGEIGFTLAGGLIDGRSPLNARQLMLVNLLTDALPALAIALQRPSEVAPEDLLEAGPEASLGRPLDREIAWRAAVTASTATAAWLSARATGSRRGADSVALMALVGSQLGQTMAAGGTSPVVLGSCVGSLAALVAVVQTPGVSRFFGCRPLGPLGLSQAAAASVAGTAVAVVGPPLYRRVRAAAEASGWLERIAGDDALRIVTESRTLGRLRQRFTARAGPSDPLPGSAPEETRAEPAP